MSLGGSLVFLISQPRAGSTLLQRILGCHPDIYTLSEPWLMLHPLFALKDGEGLSTEYDAEVARKATKDFLTHIPSGEQEYVEGVRHMYGALYRKALDKSGKRFFLDKTPRYYFIIPELYRTFPEAHFIILIRNPLAVLCSIVSTFVRGKWHRFPKYRYDIIRAPALLLEGIETLRSHGLAVCYEKLVENPENEVAKVCHWLDIKFVRSIIHYGQAGLTRWPLGDQKTVYQHFAPDSNSASNWLLALNDPQIWRLVDNYLELLGKDTLYRMGYTYEELRAVLEVRRPSKLRLRSTSSMTSLLENAGN